MILEHTKNYTQIKMLIENISYHILFPNRQSAIMYILAVT